MHPPLRHSPFQIAQATSVAFESTFLVVGGYYKASDGSFVETKQIREYGAEEGNWIIRPEEMDLARELRRRTEQCPD